MKAKEWIELLKQIPEDSDVNIYAGCEFQGDMVQRQIDYVADVTYRHNDNGDEVLSLSVRELDAHEYIEKDTETRTVEWSDETITIDRYRPYHRYQHQDDFEGGFPLNPLLRKDFDVTPNDVREAQEVNDWWGKPFIVTQDYSPIDASYTDYRTRMSSFKSDRFTLDTETAFNERVAKEKASWFDAWPTGTRFEVRCLDGGAWDRSSSKGMFATLELAIGQ